MGGFKPKKQRCEGCKYCKVIDGGGWDFYGCHHEPYKGKWVAEIKLCPKKAKEKEMGVE